MALTKIEMVKEVFFDATHGKRNPNNYAEGMWLIEAIADKITAPVIRSYFWDYVAAATDAESTLSLLVDMAYSYSCGANGYTKTSQRILSAYHRFF